MFTDLGLHDEVVRSLPGLGFSEPTPIQRAAIPAALAGRDLLATAPTGTGKTAAFLLPTLQRLRGGRAQRSPRALVLTPTRELAGQVEEQARRLAAATRLRTTSVVGGAAMGPQTRALRNGIDVLVATPGRLLDHLQQSHVRLDGVETLVLDEADRMLDMGFLPAIRQVLASLSRERQTLLFSATLPAAIVALARDLLVDPLAIDLQPRTEAAAGIRQAVYPVAQEAKAGLLIDLLSAPDIESALVFTRTKHRANRLAQTLGRQGVACAPIHGDRTQAQRVQALSGFRAGRFRVLVATDLASRGLDVEKLSHVVNFDVPRCAEDYVHRVGRTGRAQAVGDALTFVSPGEEGELRDIERTLGRRLERILSHAPTSVAPSAPHAAPARRHLPPARPRRAPGPRVSHAHAAAVPAYAPHGTRSPQPGAKRSFAPATARRRARRG